MILGTVSLDDVDILLLDNSPLTHSIVSSPGSMAIIKGSGNLYLNQNGIWKLVMLDTGIGTAVTPKYLNITNENITTMTFQAPTTYKVEVVGDGELLILDNNNLVEKIIKPPAGILFNRTSLKYYGRAMTNGRIDTLSYLSSSASLSSNPWSESNPREMWMSPDGKWVYIVGTSRDRVLWGELTTAFDLSTLTKKTSEFVVGTYGTALSAIFLSPDRKHLYTCGTSAKTITHFTLTNGDPATAVFQSSYYVGGIEGTPHSVILSNDGKYLSFIGSSGDTVYQYDLLSAWQLSSLNLLVGQLSVSSQENNPSGTSFNATGTKFYVVGFSSDHIYEYLLINPWMIGTASYSGRRFYIGSQESSPHGLFIGGPELDDRAYIVGTSSDRIHEYEFSRPTPNFQIILTKIEPL